MESDGSGEAGYITAFCIAGSREGAVASRRDPGEFVPHIAKVVSVWNAEDAAAFPKRAEVQTAKTGGRDSHASSWPREQV